MRKSRVKELLTNQTKRRNGILIFVCLIIIISVITLSLFLIYIERNKTYYVSYEENSNIDYKVYLKENDFFNVPYLSNDKEFISSLINYINANFSYNLQLQESNIDYKYTYKIEADVSVKNRTTNNILYNKTELLMEEKEYHTSRKNVEIRENINIDYNYYNELIKRFVNVYGLDDTENILTINMYVNVIGSCEKFVEDSEKASVISLVIPLTAKTTEIEFSNNLINNENNVMQCKKIYNYNFVFLILGSLFLLFDLGLIVSAIRFEIKTRTAENIYEKELKKILNNYSSYIQTLTNSFNFKEYQLLKLDTFTDMLEIRDTIRQPILMKENDDKTGAYFIIPSSSKVLYVYRLKVSDIERDIKKQNKNK